MHIFLCFGKGKKRKSGFIPCARTCVFPIVGLLFSDVGCQLGKEIRQREQKETQYEGGFINTIDCVI